MKNSKIHKIILVGPRVDCAALTMDVLHQKLIPMDRFSSTTRNINLQSLVNFTFYDVRSGHDPMMKAKFENFYKFPGLRMLTKSDALNFSQKYPNVLIRIFKTDKKSSPITFISGERFRYAIEEDREGFDGHLKETCGHFYDFLDEC